MLKFNKKLSEGENRKTSVWMLAYNLHVVGALPCNRLETCSGANVYSSRVCPTVNLSRVKQC